MSSFGIWLPSYAGGGWLRYSHGPLICYPSRGAAIAHLKDAQKWGSTWMDAEVREFGPDGEPVEEWPTFAIEVWAIPPHRFSVNAVGVIFDNHKPPETIGYLKFDPIGGQ